MQLSGRMAQLGTETAFEVLAPPLLLYWLAGALELFGERPLLW